MTRKPVRYIQYMNEITIVYFFNTRFRVKLDNMYVFKYEFPQNSDEKFILLNQRTYDYYFFYLNHSRLSADARTQKKKT